MQTPINTLTENFSKDGNLIYHGDAIHVLSRYIRNNSVDLIFADPPYNIGKNFAGFNDKWSSDTDYANWCYQWLYLCIQKLKSYGSLYVMTSTQAMPYLDLWLRERLTIMSRIVWFYDSSGVQAKKHFGSLYEPILFCVKDSNNYTFNAYDIEVEARTGAVRKLIDYRKEHPTPYKTSKVPGNIWYIPRVRYRMPEYEQHPSQKPEALMERIIKASSNAGDLVLDPFAGTFTTCAVARRLGRQTIGIEMQDNYIRIGLRRLGIASHLNGEKLKPPKKTYIRKNCDGKRHSQFKNKQLGLFDA
ncbi:MAG: adenine-specific DNA-methyltransferase [Syntrophobacteraceae bacterium]|jgi:site-specific DNA-methyltransferase (adenine-specific)